MRDKLDWQQDGSDWPNREASRFVRAAGMQWHVQVMGTGPVLLLLHGTGASTHSWGSLMPLLANDFTIVAPDLPGHAFTDTPPREFLSLPGMARAVGALLRELNLSPAVAAGHSAGAAVAIQMTASRQIVPRAIISLNGALLPLGGAIGSLFAPLAKGLAMLPFVPRIFARRARDPEAVQRLIDQTGSKLDAKGVAFYGRLAASPEHVGAALGMMANWNLDAFTETLQRLKVPLTLVVGSRDGTISPSTAARVRALLPSAQIVTLEGLGHLAHEERSEEVAAIIRAVARDVGVLPVKGE